MVCHEGNPEEGLETPQIAISSLRSTAEVFD
jgi:hypothetical protein